MLVWAWLGLAPALRADDIPDCETPLLVEVDRHGPYFDRWSFGPGHDLQTTMLEAIDRHSDRARPLLVLDTNPDPELWAHATLIHPKADARLPGRRWVDLSESEKAPLFADATARITAEIEAGARPIVLIDHHFDSELLATASTTPMVVDWLGWLHAQPPTAAIESVRGALARAEMLRDHSDADVVLATLAATWIDDPASLAAWGPRVRRIAYFNDHAHLDDGLDAVARTEVLLGFALLRAWEEYVPNHRPGGFATAVAALPGALAHVRKAAARVAPAADPVRAWLDELDADAPPAELRAVAGLVARDWGRESELAREVRVMLATGRSVRREGGVLVMDFPVAAEAASGLSILRLIRASDAPLARDARILVAVAREGDPASPRVHVKMRALRSGVRFDPVVAEVRGRGLGGGGRGTAAGLYASCGVSVSPERSAADLEWLVGALGRSQGVSDVHSE